MWCRWRIGVRTAQKPDRVTAYTRIKTAQYNDSFKFAIQFSLKYLNAFHSFGLSVRWWRIRLFIYLLNSFFYYVYSLTFKSTFPICCFCMNYVNRNCLIANWLLLKSIFLYIGITEISLNYLPRVHIWWEFQGWFRLYARLLNELLIRHLLKHEQFSADSWTDRNLLKIADKQQKLLNLIFKNINFVQLLTMCFNL